MLKKIILSMLIILLITPTFSVVSVFASLSVSADSAILIDATTGEIIYEKNAYKNRSMASTTKIMTALIALSDFDVNTEYEMTDEMVMVEGTSLGLKSGDKITLLDLVKGMMLTSGNDSANAIAISLCGSLEKFADLMNKKADEIGMQNSSFVTPSGLDADKHYTTAYDMAILTKEALNNDTFREIVSSQSLTISFGDPKQNHTVYNHNRLLKSYEGAIGVKTGFTKKSGRCLVSAAERDGVTLIAVTLNAPDDWNDHKNMLDYGFEKTDSIILDAVQYEQDVVGGNKDTVLVRSAEYELKFSGSIHQSKLSKTVILERFSYCPIKKGDILGKIVYTYNGREICSSDLVACEDVSFKNNTD